MANKALVFLAGAAATAAAAIAARKAQEVSPQLIEAAVERIPQPVRDFSDRVKHGVMGFTQNWEVPMAKKTDTAGASAEQDTTATDEAATQAERPDAQTDEQTATTEQGAPNV